MNFENIVAKGDCSRWAFLHLPQNVLNYFDNRTISIVLTKIIHILLLQTCGMWKRVMNVLLHNLGTLTCSVDVPGREMGVIQRTKQDDDAFLVG